MVANISSLKANRTSEQNGPHHLVVGDTPLGTALERMLLEFDHVLFD